MGGCSFSIYNIAYRLQGFKILMLGCHPVTRLSLSLYYHIYRMRTILFFSNAGDIMECPDLAQQCAEQIEKELDDHTVGCAVTHDGADYQRLVDRGVEEIEGYNYTEDI